MDNDVSNITEVLVREIIQGCNRKGSRAHETLATFVLKLVFQDPRNNYSEDEALDDDRVEALVDACVTRIVHDRGPVMETARMQITFLSQFVPYRDIVFEHNRTLESRIGSLTRDIIEEKARTRSEMENLYKKIVTVLVLRSGLGNPTHGSVLREACAALQSIFPQSGLNNFMNQSRMDKRVQLREMSQIVAGIRIFNWDEKRGGNGIEDLPSLMSAAVDATIRNARNLKEYTAMKIHKITAILEKILYTDLALEASEKEREKIKAGLMNLRQFSTYLSLILKDLVACSNRLSTLDQDLLGNLTELQRTIASHLSLPSKEVFPQFMRLARTWQGFQEEMVVVTTLTELYRLIYRKRDI